MIRVKEKWNNELYNICGKIPITKVKRCMAHIFEFYEETFPEHNLQATVDLQPSVL